MFLGCEWKNRGARVAAVSAAVLLGACANDAQRTRTEGAAAGAALGAVAGHVLGGNKDSTVAGAVIGGVIGAWIGNRTADKKAQYAAREAELRSSAERATALARSSSEQNEQLQRDIAALDESVQQLRTAKVSAESRQAEALAQQQKLGTLLASVDQQLHQLREEHARQAALVKAEATQTRGVAAAPPPSSEGVRLVSASMRDLEQQARTLELAKLQLQQIDRRRAY
jgi:hypothetical protein